jgi:murein DD-endopeptidase MepM/ murein hydrolase activator NlpD
VFERGLALVIMICLSLIGLRVYQHYELTEDEVEPTTGQGYELPEREVASTISQPEPPKKDPEDAGLIFPVAKASLADVISDFGDPRGSRMHQGIDIKAPRGTKVLAVTDGVIERIKDGPRAGKSIYLRGEQGRLFFYAHLEAYETEEDAEVGAGEVIGQVGNSGNAEKATPHLHFEILLGKERKPQDPATYWD